MNFARTVIALSLLSVLTFPVSAATIRVPQDKPSIQAAVTAASVGDTILLTNGLIAYYPFNGSAADASGNGNNANVQGTYQYLTNGALHLIGDNSLLYNGGGYVALPNYGNLNSGFTISIWVANETDHGTSVYSELYVSWDDNAYKHLWLSQHDFLVQDQNTFGDIPLTITDYSPWKQLVLTYSPGNCVAFLNGIMIGSTNITVSAFPMVNSAIGRHWWNGGASSSARMTMDVKNFRIYNRALSSNEVAQLYSMELKASQTITFGALPAKTFGDAPFALSASAGSGLSVSYTSGNTNVATISGSTVTIVGAGTAVITASQAGNSNYLAAADVPQSLVVSSSPVFVPPSFLTNGLVAYFPFNGNANDASGNGHNATVYGTVLNTDRFGKTNAAYHFTGGQYIDIPLDCSSQKPLTYSLWFNQDSPAQWPDQALIWNGTFDAAGNDLGIWNSTNNLWVDYQTRMQYYSSFVVTQHTWVHVTVTFSDTVILYVNGQIIGQADYPSQPVSRSSVTRLGKSQDFYDTSFEGVIDDVRIYNRALSSNEVAQLYSIELKASQTITFGALPTKTLGDAPFALSASAGSGLPVSYTSGNTNVATISGSTVTIVGVGTAVITASQAGNSNYLAAADVPQSLVVIGSSSFFTNGLVAYYPFNGNANDASGNGNGGTVYGATLTTNRFGNPNSAYLLNGISDYISISNAPANNLSEQFTISFWMNPKPGYGTPFQGNCPIIAKWGGGGVGLASYQIGITGSGQLFVATDTGTQGSVAYDAKVATTGLWHQVVFVKDENAFHLYSDNGLLFSTNIVQPQQSTLNLLFGAQGGVHLGFYGGGLDDIRIYNHALSSNEVAQLYAIELKASQTITFGALPAKTFGDAPFALSAFAGSGLPVSYTSGNTNVATISGSTVTIVGVGTTVITASQAGNSNFLAAADVSQSLIVNSSPVFVSPSFLTNGLIAYYQFNGNANDESGNGNTLTNHGALLSTDRFGASNRCFYFASNTLSGPVAGIPAGNSPRTLSLWLETTNHLNNNGDAIEWGLDGLANSSRRFGFTVSHGKPYFCGSFNDLSGNSFIADGNWHHVVITYTNSTVTMFVDGQFDVSGMKTLNTASTQLVLGDDVSVNYYYNGCLDDIRIYNRALSSNEVAQLYAIDPKTSQTITFGALPTKTLVDAPFALSASASSGLPVSYTSGNTNVATISGFTVTIVGVGTTVITASQAGNSYLLAATNVSQSLIVNALPDGFRLVAGTAIAAQGGSVVIPVQVFGFTNITSFQFSMHWNPAVASFTGIEQYGLGAMDIGNFNTNPAPSGTLTVSWEDVAGTGVTTTNGSIIFALRFTLVGNAGDVSPVSFDSVPTLMEVVNDQNAIPVTVATGQVTILSRVQIAGTVNSYGTGKAVPGVTLDLTGSQTQQVVVGSDGRYSFTVNPGGNYTVTPSKLSETPASQGVTTADITLIRRHILGTALFDSPFKLIAADANDSGSVTTADITLIRRLILGISTNLPAGAWKFVRSDFAFANTNSPWPFDTNRIYASIPADALTQDFIAVRVGDVNGSWTSAAVSLRAAKSALSGQRVVFQASQTNGPVGGSAKVFITVAGFTNVTSAQFTLEWDPAVLQFVNTSDFGLTGLTADSFGTALTNSGKLTVSWNDLSTMGVSVADGLVMFSVQFNVIGTNGATSIVTFGDNPTVREVVVGLTPAEFGSQPGRVTVGKPVTFQFSADSSLTVSNGAFRMHLVGITGTGPLIIERSTNLVNWTSVYTNSAPCSVLDFEDLLNASERARFYRGAFLP